MLFRSLESSEIECVAVSEVAEAASEVALETSVENVEHESAQEKSKTSIQSIEPTSSKAEEKPIKFNIHYEGMEFPADLDAKLQKILASDTYTTGFFVESIDKTKRIYYNKDRRFFLASTVKAAVGLYAYKSASDQVSSLLPYIESMLHISDNEAYLHLLDHFGRPNIQSYISNFGMSSWNYKVDWAWGSAQDAAKLWHNIYDFVHSGDEWAQKMKSDIENAQWHSSAMNLAEKGYTIGHKEGWNGVNNAFTYGCNMYVIRAGKSSYIWASYNNSQENPGIQPQLLQAMDNYF